MTTLITTRLPSGPQPVRFLGGVPLLGNLPEFTKDRLGLFQRMAHTGDVCGIHFGPFPSVLFNKPEHVQSILVKHADAFDKGAALQRIVRPAIGDGIVTSEGAFHRHQRKLMAPPFQPSHLAGYAASIAAYGEQLQQTWSDGGEIDLNQQMSNVTMSIIGKVFFGADVFTAADHLGSAMMTFFEYISRTILTPFPLPYRWPLPLHRRMHAAMKVVRASIQQFIKQRRADPGAYSDFLAVLLQARDEDGAPMSDEQLMAECLTLFGSGYETTAAALSWTWYLLCRHPETYQKVQHEVDTVLQGRTPTAADLEHLPYSLQVFKEAMRLYPPAYVICRNVVDEIEIDGYRVRKGWTVLLSPYTLHRREEYFPEPERFDPTRFTPEREKRLPRYAYLPFGAGPRVCIGLHFAMMEGHLLLATLAQRASFALLPGQATKPDLLHHLVLRPAGMVRAKVTKR